MAIIPNKDGAGIGAGGGQTTTDKPFTSPNRKNAGSPLGALTPMYSGEIVLDTTTGDLWYATDTTNSGWAPATIGA